MPSADTDDRPSGELSERRAAPRRSLIVVLPENHVVSPDRLAEGLRAHGDQQVDVVIACAGQPANLTTTQESLGEAQLLFAPAGTTTEDLRELAMRQAPGDIVTLLCGDVVSESCVDAVSS
jgi:hypothetical protein